MEDEGKVLTMFGNIWEQELESAHKAYSACSISNNRLHVLS